MAFAFLLLFPAWAAPLSVRSKGSSASLVGQDYIIALATADHFLHAWQTQDAEAGILLLTDRLKLRTHEDVLQNFFSSSAYTRQSFEIGRGKKLRSGRYEFPVALFQKSSSETGKRAHPQASALVVVRAGKNDWAIDKLP
jgi:hypothetical protein